MGSPAVARFAIKEAARRQGVSLKQLALRSGISETRVRDLANNRIDNATVYTLEVLAATLNVPLRDVFEQSTLDEIPTRPERDARRGARTNN